GLVGRDQVGQIVRSRLVTDSRHLDIRVVDIAAGPQTVVLYEDGGERMVLNDPGDAGTGRFPDHLVDDVADSAYPVTPNIDAHRTRPAAGLAAGVPVVTDVHALTALDDPHNAACLTAASVLFCSDAELPCPPHDWLRTLGERFGTPLIVMGRGQRGAMLTAD